MSTMREPVEIPVRCAGSNGVQSVTGKVVVDGVERDAWACGERKPCNVCGQMVRFRVRGTDLPPWARILPHRVDGSPCR